MFWQKPPSVLPSLSPNTVHIWRANLDHYEGSPILSPDEVIRAARFKFPIHQKRYTAARTILRRILSHYLNQTPDTLAFAYTKYGKPYLPNTPLYFNLSHAEQWALYAVSLEEKTGVDIEYIKTDREMVNIAERFFSDYENQWLKQVSDAEKIAAFFRIWTCKEAFIKAVGEGLSFPLKDFDVHVDQHTCRLLSVRKDKKEAAAWSCLVIDAPEGYAATLAVRSDIKALELWEVAS